MSVTGVRGLPPDPFPPQSTETVFAAGQIPAPIRAMLEYQAAQAAVLQLHLESRGLKGTTSFCLGCRTEHYLSWQAMEEAAAHLLNGQPPPHHEPPAQVNEQEYETIGFCVGVVDGLHDTIENLQRAQAAESSMRIAIESGADFGENVHIETIDMGDLENWEAPDMPDTEFHPEEASEIAADIQQYCDLLSPHGMRGTKEMCAGCRDMHCFTWGAMLRDLNGDANPGHITPVPAPNLDLYVDTDYAAGFIEGHKLKCLDAL